VRIESDLRASTADAAVLSISKECSQGRSRDALRGLRRAALISGGHP